MIALIIGDTSFSRLCALAKTGFLPGLRNIYMSPLNMPPGVDSLIIVFCFNTFLLTLNIWSNKEFKRFDLGTLSK